MFALLGGFPTADFGPNLRLAMSGVGQCVAPLQALWTFAHVRKLLDGFLGRSQCQPDTIVREYAAEVLQACAVKWPSTPVPMPGSPDPIEDATPVNDSPVATRPEIQVEVRWHQDATVHAVTCAPQTTARHVLEAEQAIHGHAVADAVWVAGELMDLDLVLTDGVILDFGLQPPAVSETLGSAVSDQVPPVSGDWNVYAVSTLTALHGQRQELMPRSERLQILQQ